MRRAGMAEFIDAIEEAEQDIALATMREPDTDVPGCTSSRRPQENCAPMECLLADERTGDTRLADA